MNLLVKERISSFGLKHAKPIFKGTLIAGGVWLATLTGANLWDWAAREDAPMTQAQDGRRLPSGTVMVDKDGYLLTHDESADIDYWPWIISLPVPLLATLMLATNFNDKAWSILNSKKEVKGSLNKFVESKSYRPASIEAAWIDGIQRSVNACESIRRLKKSMDGPFVDSVKSAYDTAVNTHKRNVDRYRYFGPVISSGALENPAILRATEELAIDVKAMEDLLYTCAHLYTASEMSVAHTKIIANEVESIEQRLQALREMDGMALMPVNTPQASDE